MRHGKISVRGAKVWVSGCSIRPYRNDTHGIPPFFEYRLRNVTDERKIYPHFCPSYKTDTARLDVAPRAALRLRHQVTPISRIVMRPPSRLLLTLCACVS